MSDYIPEVGKAIGTKDLEMIFDAIKERQAKFDQEPASLSMVLVMLNIGDRFSPVECIEGEWTALKKDIPLPPEGSIPKCPNGHPLTQGPGLRLGWIREE